MQICRPQNTLLLSESKLWTCFELIDNELAPVAAWTLDSVGIESVTNTPFDYDKMQTSINLIFFSTNNVIPNKLFSPISEPLTQNLGQKFMAKASGDLQSNYAMKCSPRTF